MSRNPEHVLANRSDVGKYLKNIPTHHLSLLSLSLSLSLSFSNTHTHTHTKISATFLFPKFLFNFIFKYLQSQRDQDEIINLDFFSKNLLSFFTALTSTLPHSGQNSTYIVQNDKYALKIVKTSFKSHKCLPINFKRPYCGFNCMKLCLREKNKDWTCYCNTYKAKG